MKKGIQPGTENRYNLSKLCREKGMTATEFRTLIEPMRDKIGVEKEEMAKELIKFLTSK